MQIFLHGGGGGVPEQKTTPVDECTCIIYAPIPSHSPVYV